MNTADVSRTLARLFAELVDGPDKQTGGFVLNTGDAGVLRSLDKLSAADASRSANEGATIAAHVQHLRYGLSLMNRWAAEGGNPFMDYQLPQAVLQLKQGAGRLIRDEEDRGVLVLCDPRLYTKGYGRNVRASLPPMKQTRALEDVVAFFDKIPA